MNAKRRDSMRVRTLALCLLAWAWTGHAATDTLGGGMLTDPRILAPGGRFHDAHGRYLGRKESDGRLYDAAGRYQGRIDKDGRVFDPAGRYQGRVSPQR